MKVHQGLLNLWSHQHLLHPVFATPFIQSNLVSFPNDSLPLPDDEILSGHEEDVSSLRDDCTASVKADPASILERYMINLNSANPAFREAKDRKHSPTNEEYRFDTDVPNRLTEQKRLSIYNWNPGPRRGKEGAIEKHIAENGTSSRFTTT